METKELTKIFKGMEQKRFKSLYDIQKYLEDKFKNYDIDLGFKTYEDDEVYFNDYEIVVEILNEGIQLIDLDLYFLYDRRNMIYITEYSFEEE